MTNPTPHGQVPNKYLTVVYRDIAPGKEARELIEHPKMSASSWSHALNDRDAAIAQVSTLRTAHVQNPAEIEHDAGDVSKNGAGLNMSTQHTRIAELEAQIEALSGVQALSAAPAVPAAWKAVPVNPTPEMWKAAKSVPHQNPYGLVWDAMLAASPTPPAEQQAQPGVIYAVLPAPTASIGTDDAWHEAAMRDFADRTHAARLRCKSEQARLATLWGYVRADATPKQAAPKAAPGEPTDSDGFGSAEHWKEKAQYWAGVAHRLRGEALRGEPVDGIVQPPAPQQEAQALSDDTKRLDWMDKDAGERVFHVGADWYTRPTYGQPYRKHKNLRAAIDAALAAQGGE